MKRSATNLVGNDEEGGAESSSKRHFVPSKRYHSSLDVAVYKWKCATEKMRESNQRMIDECQQCLNAMAPDSAKTIYRSTIVRALRSILGHCQRDCPNLPIAERLNFRDDLVPKARVTDANKVMYMLDGALYFYISMCQRSFAIQDLILNFNPVSFGTWYPEPSIIANNFLSLLTMAAKVSPKALWKHLIVNNRERDQWFYWLAFNLIDLGYFCFNQSCILFDEPKCNCQRLITNTLEIIRSRPLTLKQLARLAIRKSMRDMHIVKDCYKLPLEKDLQDYVSLKYLGASIRPWILERKEEHTCYRAVMVVSNRYNIVLPRCDCPSPNDSSE